MRKCSAFPVVLVGLAVSSACGCIESAIAKATFLELVNVLLDVISSEVVGFLAGVLLDMLDVLDVVNVVDAVVDVALGVVEVLLDDVLEAVAVVLLVVLLAVVPSTKNILCVSK